MGCSAQKTVINQNPKFNIAADVRNDAVEGVTPVIEQALIKRFPIALSSYGMPSERFMGTRFTVVELSLITMAVNPTIRWPFILIASAPANFKRLK